MAANPTRRDSRRYRALCADQKAKQYPCWLCGHPIDYTITGLAAARSPDAFTLDHLVPLSLGGELEDPANARSAHRRCNSARGNRLSPPRRDNSRRW